MAGLGLLLCLCSSTGIRKEHVVAVMTVLGQPQLQDLWRKRTPCPWNQLRPGSSDSVGCVVNREARWQVLSEKGVFVLLVCPYDGHCIWVSTL